MEFLEPGPLPVMRLTPDTIRAVAKWLAEPDAAGFSWHGQSWARFRTPLGEFSAPVGSWIVKLGSHAIALTAQEFESLFGADRPGPS